MMTLNLMATSKEIMDLTSLGIEGVNWEAVGEDQYRELTPYTPSNWWGWRNIDLMRTKFDENATEVDVKVKALNEYYLENLRPEHVLDGFNFDATKVSTQFAAVEAAMGTYWYPLLNGFVDDVDATIAQFKAALEVAGMNDILAETQAQIDAFVAAQ
jgi:putative aldouronate transport system substrate-binding protein